MTKRRLSYAGSAVGPLWVRCGFAVNGFAGLHIIRTNNGASVHNKFEFYSASGLSSRLQCLELNFSK